MFNKICEWFARKYIPTDTNIELADALFNWKHR